MKLINWLKAIRISFQVAQNARRLALLQSLANEYDPDVSEIRQINLLTYRNVCAVVPDGTSRFDGQHLAAGRGPGPAHQVIHADCNRRQLALWD